MNDQSSQMHERGGEARAPIGFDREQEILWTFGSWRDDFRKRLSRRRWSILLSFLRINSVAVLLSILIGRLIHFNLSLTISEASLLTLAIGIVSASGAILAVIVAFLTFWFGSSMNSMQRVRTRIWDELTSLKDIKEQVEPYTNKPKESVSEPLKGRLVKLASKSQQFIDSLKVIAGRFHRAGASTYYDETDLFELRTIAEYTGGNWFKAYVTSFAGHEEHDFARKTWIKAMDVTQRLGNLNLEAMSAARQVDQVIIFMPFLASIVLTFIFALVVAFMASASYGDGSPGTLLPVTKLILGSTLIILLPVQLIGITGHLWSLFLSKQVADETRRMHDKRQSEFIESKYSFDYEGALRKKADAIIRAWGNDNRKSGP